MKKKPPKWIFYEYHWQQHPPTDEERHGTKGRLVDVILAKSDILALDKTGTITEGKPSVVTADFYEDFNPALLHALVSTSNHPVSQGIKTYLEIKHEKLETLTLEEIKSIEAKGLSASYQGETLIG